MYHANTIYIIGESKTSSNNAIMQQYNGFFIALVVDRVSHTIIDAECSSTINITSSFIKSIVVGKSMLDLDTVLKEVENRYFGSSQKAVMVAFKNAHIKYKQLLKELV
ncbi:MULTISPECIES: DUF3870 domain-containing protein [Niallia]|jgi:hypothetical protein|uniref:Uncharacterized protein n=1 Tax=Niallia circulans TaxID=1397 RepID=A0A268FB39_NIACI|nr:DUF3870 domain-containing protein [Niallia circulans]AYV69061.1 DUF3870 domain-containing protein [Niallia circulans]AYV72547.1 DUF3870 domain-containing protein [Niallia circulans]NRG27275.1 DUF3870 domain-containing protein [Niallia circulans]PAD82588.1 hypothetical protein CHH57_14290 [Niallia circulans]QJX60538.1 DUF3870 domain-containing protein [Niallia circulans]